MSSEANRAAQARVGVRVEVFSVIWMVIEATISIGAGLAAGSVLLTAFGLDSAVELVSAGVLLRRLSLAAREGDIRRVEHDYVFCTLVGTHLRPSHVVDEFKKLLKKGSYAGSCSLARVEAGNQSCSL
jgi:hypothetical protein